MADKILKELTLKIWRQKDAKSKGEFKTYKVHNISTGTSFLEMLDILNEQLVEQNEEPVAFDQDVYKRQANQYTAISNEMGKMANELNQSYRTAYQEKNEAKMKELQEQYENLMKDYEAKEDAINLSLIHI